MASPLKTGKQSVSLTSSAPRVSRIRRDPPPVVKAKIVLDPEEREQWEVVVGVLTLALALFIIIIGFSSFIGWTPSQYTVHV